MSVFLPSAPGDELPELLWDSGPSLRRAPPPFPPFTCSAAGSSTAQERKRHRAELGAGAAFLGVGGMHDVPDDGAVPWPHCPLVDDGGTAPLPPEYFPGLLPGLAAELPAVLAAARERPPSHTAAPRAAPPETAAKQAPTGGGEGVVNFTFFSRPLHRAPHASPSNPAAEPSLMQTAVSRLRSTPLFSEQRMAWLQPPAKGPRTTAAPPAPPAPPLPAQEQRHGLEPAATVTQHRLQPEARAPDAAAVVTTSSVCSGNGDRSRPKRSFQHTTTDCSVSQDEDLDEEAGAARRSAARSAKRCRTAEVHNLSERRRRDRINEKMRALQELIPNCNKIDKASMLEEAIEYLKNLQLQVQMMAMGTGLCVPPVLLPSVAMQLHLPVPLPPMAAHFPHHLGMGLGFGMGAAAFDMLSLPRVAAQFPCPVMPPMAMPPGSMFGVPGQAMPAPAPPFLQMSSAVRAGQMEPPAAAAAPARGGGGAGAAGDDPPPVPAAPHVA